MGLVLDGANRHDVKVVDSTLASLPPAAEAARDAHRAAGGEQGLCRDAGYDAKQVRETLTALGDTAHSRFQHWVQAGVFARLCDEALGDYDDLIGLNFSWLALDGSLHKAPLGGEINSPPHGPRQRRSRVQPAD